MRNILIISICWTVLPLFVACAAESQMSGSEDRDSNLGADEDTASKNDSGYTPSDFYRQCTDSICQFKMIEGERWEPGVATWHPADTGFSLIGNPAVVTVVDSYAAHPAVPVACYTVTVLGNWDDDVQLFFDVTGQYGIFGMTPEEEMADPLPVSLFEGEFEWTRRLSANHWKPVTLTIRAPKHRGQMNFSFRKEGDGYVLFYLLEVNGQPLCPADAIVVD
ncbi:MAG: hypothetical protein JXX14_08270 [Deltaproteobacteria bacterium]|nr:hypothetical protein [Deltaproteobacteria bacterium]